MQDLISFYCECKIYIYIWDFINDTYLLFIIILSFDGYNRKFSAQFQNWRKTQVEMTEQTKQTKSAKQDEFHT